jgi:hypothetical protein
MITKAQPPVKMVRREQENQIHRNQLWWSGLIALVLAAAALAKWSAPKNALMEQDRNPASYRSDSKSLGSNE